MKCATTLPFLLFVLSGQLLIDLSEAHSYSLINPFQRNPYRHPRSCCRHSNCGCGKLATHKQYYVPVPQPAPCRVVKSLKPQQFTEVVYIDDKSTCCNQNPADCSTCQVQPCPCATKSCRQTGKICAGKCNPTACDVCQPEPTICSNQGLSTCGCECHQGNRMVRRSVDYVKDEEQDAIPDPKRLYVVYDPESSKTEEMPSEKFVQKRSEEAPVQFFEERAEQPRPVYQHQQLQNSQSPLKVRRILQVVQPGDSEYEEVVEAYEESSDADSSQVTEIKPAAYKLVLRNANGDDILVDADSAIVEDEPEQKEVQDMTMATPSMVRVQKVEVPATSTAATTSEETTTRTA
ncbi:hypothetical protein TKK_0012129 [Trichogramma kaykai]|uniref:Uncharacterized protein n=1 Tax=Trichogramma kaykai TaxID=54128 RepID=A0ABD2WMJ4_9HYME